MIEVKGRRVLVVGLGVSGYAAAGALHARGASVRVTDALRSDAIAGRAATLDTTGIEVEIGGHDVTGLDRFDLAVVSPGIPPTAPILVALRSAGVELMGEIELAYRMGKCDFLAVTGTNGKTTTTSLLADMLAEGGVPSEAAGNIGTALVDVVGRIGAGGAIAVEVSSFQLETTTTFRPKVAVLLNVAEDHTDWHSSFEAYARAKARVTAHQAREDVFVYNLDDATARAIAKGSRARLVPFSYDAAPRDGIGRVGGVIEYRGETLMSVDDLPMAGRAAVEDVCAAAAAALEYGVGASAIVRAVKGFRLPPHRLERVATIDGTDYIDDSKATNPHATLAAVRDLTDVVLIAGGRSKGIDLRVLRDAVPPVRAVVALGEAAEELRAIFDGVVDVATATDMGDAVRLARARSIPGGSVLLSPACASLDMYKSYAERGEAFARAVRKFVHDPVTRKEG